MGKMNLTNDFSNRERIFKSPIGPAREMYLPMNLEMEPMQKEQGRNRK